MDVTTLADALAPVLRDLVDETVAPLVARLETTERQLADARGEIEILTRTAQSLVEQPTPPTAEEVAALVQKATPSITTLQVAEMIDETFKDRQPKDGKDADPEVIASMVKEAVAAVTTTLEGAVDVAVSDARAVNDAALAEMKAAYERSIADLPKVPTAEEVAALVPAAKDGNDADPEVIRAMVAEQVAALPKAVDGTSVTIDDVRPLVDEVVAAKVAEIPAPQDGKDVDLDVVRNLIADEVRVQVADLPPPENGKDASPEAIAAEVEKVLATWDRPKDGKSVTLEEVLPALQERLDKAVAALPVAKDGVGLAGALIDSDGVLVVTLTDGGLHKLGPVRGKDGADGLGDGDFELVDGPIEFTVRLVRGDLVKEWKIAKPTLADMHQGIWREGAYKRGAVVTWGGSQWLAVADTEGRPETTKDWTLVVKRGRDGKDLTPSEPKPPKSVKL